MTITHEFEPGEVYENGERECSYNYLRYRFHGEGYTAEAWAYLDEVDEIGIRDIAPEGVMPAEVIRYLNDRFDVIEVFKDGRPVRLEPAAIEEIIQ